MAYRAINYAIHALLACLGISLLLWVVRGAVSVETPFKWLDSWVQPQAVLRGERVAVFRHYIVKRDAVVTVSRRLVQGNCAADCASYDLEPSTNLFLAGEYKYTRYHRIPDDVRPGHYTLEFEVIWQNQLGKYFGEHLPSLEIDVR